MNIYRTFNPTTEYIFFSRVHGTYTKMDNVLRHTHTHNQELKKLKPC